MKLYTFEADYAIVTVLAKNKYVAYEYVEQQYKGWTWTLSRIVNPAKVTETTDISHYLE